MGVFDVQRARVFFGSLARKTVRCAAPRPLQLCCASLQRKSEKTLIWGKKSVFFIFSNSSTKHLQVTMGNINVIYFFCLYMCCTLYSIHTHYTRMHASLQQK